MTPDNGLMAGYVRGGRSTRLRPVLMPSNLVQAEFRARTGEQLASLTVELEHSRGPLFGEPLPAAAIVWSCALTAAALPEEQAYPLLYETLDGMLSALEGARAGGGVNAAVARADAVQAGSGRIWRADGGTTRQPHSRTGAQPRAIVWRAFTRCGNCLVVRADGFGPAGGAGLSAAL